jgi:hypothetical protein
MHEQPAYQRASLQITRCFRRRFALESGTGRTRPDARGREVATGAGAM